MVPIARMAWDSVGGIAIQYCPGIETQWDEDFLPI